MHSFLAKGRLLYTHDPTIADLCARLADIGARDTAGPACLRAATNALPPIDKAHKWFVTRGDLDYTALWILYAATPLAQIEVIGRGLLADREVIPQALTLNPTFFTTVYTDLLNAQEDAARRSRRRWTPSTPTSPSARRRCSRRSSITCARSAKRARAARSTIISSATSTSDGVTTACEYLADQRLIGKASAPVRLTKRSNVEVQELAFFYHSGDLTDVG